jgi:N-acetylglucosamine kinase-like BadF-type ATPase
MQFFIGIDGGQSSTTVLIAREDGRVVGTGRGGPCNHVSGPEAAAKFQRVMRACIAEACASAGLDPETARFEAAHCGMSGGPHDKAALLSRILRANRIGFSTDGEIALSGALAGAAGVAVIAGTGSIAFGRDESGRVARAGGWGYIFGDEGSAFDIVRQAARAALRSEEGWGPATALHPALLGATDARDANQMLHLFYTAEWPRARVAALATLVDSTGGEGDPIARAILDQAAQTLAGLAASVRTQLFADSAAVRVAYIGGVFRSQALLERFRLIVELTDGCRCVAPLLDPAAGALLEAFRSAERSITLFNIPLLK